MYGNRCETVLSNLELLIFFLQCQLNIKLNYTNCTNCNTSLRACVCWRLEMLRSRGRKTHLSVERKWCNVGDAIGFNYFSYERNSYLVRNQKYKSNRLFMWHGLHTNGFFREYVPVDHVTAAVLPPEIDVRRAPPLSCVGLQVSTLLHIRRSLSVSSENICFLVVWIATNPI